jgi:hypothetical protein
VFFFPSFICSSLFFLTFAKYKKMKKACLVHVQKDTIALGK